LASINLTKIESRPAKKNLGDYLFFIDLMGHREDPVVKECLETVEELSASFRILGSYSIWGGAGNLDTYADSFAGGTPDTLSVTELRENIDIIDYQIVELLARRTQLVSLIGTLKNGYVPVRDPGRESEILDRVRKNAARKGVDPGLAEKVYQILFDHFVELQLKQAELKQKI